MQLIFSNFEKFLCINYDIDIDNDIDNDIDDDIHNDIDNDIDNGIDIGCDYEATPGYSYGQWLLTSEPMTFGLVVGWAFPTGVILMLGMVSNIMSIVTFFCLDTSMYSTLSNKAWPRKIPQGGRSPNFNKSTVLNKHAGWIKKYQNFDKRWNKRTV